MPHYVQITEEMRRRCYEFSREIVLQENQYNRIDAPTRVRIERTYVGKIAEYAVLNFLRSKGIPCNEGNMFVIIPGETNADTFDFELDNGQTIDVKCASKPNHSRIMIPCDQLKNHPKDFYIGVKLLNVRLYYEDGIELIDFNSVQLAEVIGYCTYDDVIKMKNGNWQFPCKWTYLNNLRRIEELLPLFSE